MVEIIATCKFGNFTKSYRTPLLRWKIIFELSTNQVRTIYIQRAVL